MSFLTNIEIANIIRNIILCELKKDSSQICHFRLTADYFDVKLLVNDKLFVEVTFYMGTEEISIVTTKGLVLLDKDSYQIVKEVMATACEYYSNQRLNQAWNEASERFPPTYLAEILANTEK